MNTPVYRIQLTEEDAVRLREEGAQADLDEDQRQLNELLALALELGLHTIEGLSVTVVGNELRLSEAPGEEATRA